MNNSTLLRNVSTSKKIENRGLKLLTFGLSKVQVSYTPCNVLQSLFQ